MKIKILTILFIMTNVLYGQQLDSIKKIVFNDFSKTFKNESFRINDDVKTTYMNEDNEDEIFFEIEIVPQKKGIYFIKQIFGWGLRYDSILNIIKVAEKGTPRYFEGTEPDPYTSYTCSVGDTIIIPVYWDKHIVFNEFSTGEELERKILEKIDTTQTRSEGERLDWNITNNVNELKVIDVFSRTSSHHVYPSLYRLITFKAIKSGEFILEIGTFKVPIVIYPQESAIRKKVTQVEGTQYYNSDLRASTRWYKKEPEYALLRVGDFITLTFLEYEQEINNPKKIDLTIEINKILKNNN
ncbi:MAG: hypothetical protein L3J20_06235 [Flavobacteriaceae bacterium]|nr:hypothetical protein [Flavobacteriaceae bacterium]